MFTSWPKMLGIRAPTALTGRAVLKTGSLTDPVGDCNKLLNVFELQFFPFANGNDHDPFLA